MGAGSDAGRRPRLVTAAPPSAARPQWGKWPPVAFLRMKHDPEVNARIGRNQAALKDAGVPAQVIEVGACAWVLARRVLAAVARWRCSTPACPPRSSRWAPGGVLASEAALASAEGAGQVGAGDGWAQQTRPPTPTTCHSQAALLACRRRLFSRPRQKL